MGSLAPSALEPAGKVGPDRGAGPRLHGAIDLIRPDRIAGWVIDRTDPAAHAAVEILREGRPVASAPADRPRRDLVTAGVGTGAYGFSVPLDPPLEEGMEFTLCVRAFTPDGAEILIRPSARHGTTSVERRILARLIEEVAACRRLLDEREPTAEMAAMLGRIEVAQARLESLAAGVEAPAAPGRSGLWLLSAAAMATAGLSLAAAIVSLWG